MYVQLAHGFTKMLMNFFFAFSGHDGDPEYLNDLDRQVMQKERLRQVRLSILRKFSMKNSYFYKKPLFLNQPPKYPARFYRNESRKRFLLFTTRLTENAMLNLAAITFQPSIAFGVELVAVHRK